MSSDKSCSFFCSILVIINLIFFILIVFINYGIQSWIIIVFLLIAIIMQLSQQLSGINAVFYYSTNLFITTGLTETHAKLATIGIGLVMVIMTLISIPLMDRSGRRTLHLYGLGGMFIFSIFITISFLVKACQVDLL